MASIQAPRFRQNNNAKSVLSKFAPARNLSFLKIITFIFQVLLENVRLFLPREVFNPDEPIYKHRQTQNRPVYVGYE